MTYLNFIDISHWEGTVDWNKFANSDHKQSAVVVKATEGWSFLDDQFKNNKAGLEDHGFIWGAYHFFQSDEDPVRQAEWYLKTVGDWKPGMLPPILDFENRDASPNKTQSRIGEWIKRIEKETMREVIIYTAAGIWNEKCDPGGGLEWIKNKRKLWIANYDTVKPTLPRGWTDWWAWQYNTNGRFAGIPGACDVNYLKCTEQELGRLAEIGKIPAKVYTDKEKLDLLWDAHKELHG